MGFISTKRKSNKRTAGTTVIASGCHIEGSVKLASNLHLDGDFHGQITCQGVLSIGRDGCLEGEVEAKRVIISGKLKGHCQADQVEITRHGLLDGDVVADELIIEKGGHFSGNSREAGAELLNDNVTELNPVDSVATVQAEIES